MIEFMILASIVLSSSTEQTPQSSLPWERRATGGTGFKYTFHETTNEVFDELRGVPLSLGSSADYFDPYDPADPQLRPNRGLYFAGNSTATISATTYSPSHTVDMTLFVLETQSIQSLFQKNPSSPYLESAVVPVGTQFNVSVKYTALSEAEDIVNATVKIGPLPFKTWLRLTWSVDYQPLTGTQLTVWVDGEAVLTQVMSLERLYDRFNDVTVLGGNIESFAGYLFTFAVYDRPLQSVGDLGDSLPCPCTHCFYDGQCLDPCLPHEFLDASGNCTACDDNCATGCARTGDCRLHPNAACSEYSSLLHANCEMCVLKAVETETGCACGSHAELNSDHTMCVCSAGHWEVGGECVKCERWVTSADVTAYFSGNYMEIIFEFGLAIQYSDTDCSEVFPESVAALFGTGWECLYLNQDRLIVRLGEDFTRLTQSIQLTKGILLGWEIECGYLPEDLVVTVEERYRHPAPRPKLVYPSAVNYLCEDLLVDAGGSAGRIKHTLTFAWQIESNPLNEDVTNNPQIDYSAKDLFIPREFLTDAELTITLVLTNFLGMRGMQTIRVASQTEKSISILLDTSMDLSFLSTELVDYSVTSVRICGESVDYSSVWVLEAATGNSTAIDEEALWQAQPAPNVLVIPARHLPPDTQATFRIDATVAPDQQESLSFTVESVAALPVIVFDRSPGHIGRHQVLRVDASDSYDPNQFQPLTFNWECEFYESSCNELIEDIHSSVLVVRESKLQLDATYNFRLSVSTEYAGELVSNVRQLRFTVVEPNAPSVRICTARSCSQPDVVSAQRDLRLQLIADLQTNPTYEWTVDKGGSYELSSGTTGRTFTIRRNSLNPGFHYSVKLQLVCEHFTYAYTFDFYVNMPPALGDFEIIADPVEFTAESLMRASNWVDPENDYPLYYSFGFTFQYKKFYLNIRDTKASLFTQLPFSENLDFWVEVYDRRGDCSHKTVTVDIARNPELDLHMLTEEFKEKIQSAGTNYHQLPELMNLLAVRVINEELLIDRSKERDSTDLTLKQEAFSTVIEGYSTFLQTVPQFLEQDVTSVLSILELTTKNPVLITTENGRAVVETVEALLNRTATDPGLSYAHMSRLLSVLDHLMLGTQDSVYNSTTLTTLTLELGRSLQVKYSAVMNFDEHYEDATEGMAMAIFHAQTSRVGGLSLSGAGVTMKLPEAFDSQLAGYFPSGEVIVGLSVITAEAGTNGTVPDIADVTIYDYYTGSHPSIDLGQSYILFNIPVVNLNPDAPVECVFLDESLEVWNTDGCIVESVTSDEIACRCNHLTAFSAGEALAAASRMPENSNVNELGSPEKLKDLDEINPAGLSFCCTLIVLYVALLTWAILSSKKRADSSRGSITSKSAEMDKVETGGPAETEQEEEPIELNKPKGFKALVGEKHELLGVFLADHIELDRVTRASIAMLALTGEVFLLGVFYDHEEAEDADLLDISFTDVVKSYSWTDFWAMTLTFLIMLVLLIIFKALFKQSLPSDESEEAMAVATKRNKAKKILGYVIANSLIVFFFYSILIFSVTFSQKSCYLWVFNSAVELFCDFFVFQIAKIFLVAYAIVIFSRLKYKRQSKEHREQHQASPSVSSNED